MGAASLALAVLGCAGCIHDLIGDKAASSLGAGGAPHHAASPAAKHPGDDDQPPPAPGLTPPGRTAQSRQLAPPHNRALLPAEAASLRQDQIAEVLEGLQALERLDPQTRATIQASLDRTHPANWPYVFRFYRTALSCRVSLAALGHGGDPVHAQQPVWGFPRREAAGPPGPVAQNPASTNPLSTTPASNPVSAAVPPSGIPAAQDGRLATSQPKASARPRRGPTVAADRAGSSEGHDATPASHPHWWPASAQKTGKTDPPEASADDASSPLGGWEQHLDQAIQTLEAQTHDSDDPYHHALLRVLYAVSGRREDALRPIPSATEAQREFWTNEMRGLTECLDTRQAGSPDRRAAEAARWFRDAASRLSEMGALDVRNLAFCTAIQSFGAVERFAKNEFQPGDEVLLYAEIENFATESTKAGHRTAFKARYDVLEGPRRVHDQELPTAEETCERQRRDFFVSYRLRLPTILKPGEYTLQLTIDDTLGRKTATRSIGFKIK